MGKRIKSSAQLDQTPFEQFDFIYLRGGPAWTAEDFSKSEETLMTKLVKNHSYPSGTSGRALLPKLIPMAQERGVKVLLAIPGAKEFNPIARDGKKRALFAKVMAAFVKKYNYDGLEIDWEHTYVKEHHTALMGAIRKELNLLAKEVGPEPREYYLTTALHTFRVYTREQAKQLLRSVDWVNIMTYDYGGGTWGKQPSHNTPLARIKKDIQTKWSVFPAKKLCIGLASYGFLYKGIAPNQKVDSLKKMSKVLPHTELAPLLKAGWTEQYDAKEQVPYYFSPEKKDFVSIDNNRSHSRKMEWVFEHGFRGVFWWEFHRDYCAPSPGEKYGKHPLVDHVTKLINAHNLKR